MQKNILCDYRTGNTIRTATKDEIRAAHIAKFQQSQQQPTAIGSFCRECLKADCIHSVESNSTLVYIRNLVAR